MTSIQSSKLTDSAQFITLRMDELLSVNGSTESMMNCLSRNVQSMLCHVLAMANKALMMLESDCSLQQKWSISIQQDGKGIIAKREHH